MEPPPALTQTGFRSVWVAGLISETGDWMLLIALPIAVYGLTGSTSGTALALLAELAPAVALAPLAGRLADRVDRRRLMIGISLLQAAALVPLATVNGPGGLPLVYGVIVLQASLATVFQPAKNAFLPTLLQPEALVSGNSLIALNAAIGRLVGGPLGGLLLAAGDLRTIVVVDAVSFLVAAGLISRVPGLDAATHPRPGAGDQRRPSLRNALAPARIRAALLVAFVADVAQGIFLVLFIVFVARRLHAGAGAMGLLRGVQAVGAIAGGLVLATRARCASPSLLISGAALAFGTIDLAIWNAPALTTGLAVYLGLFVLAGAPGVALETGFITLLQLDSPNHVRGRVFAALGVAEGAGQAVGMGAAAILTPRLGLTGLLNAQGLLYLAAGLMATASLSGGYRRLRRGPRTTRRGRGNGDSRLAASPASSRGSSLATTSRSSSR